MTEMISKAGIKKFDDPCKSWYVLLVTIDDNNVLSSSLYCLAHFSVHIFFKTYLLRFV